MNTPVSLRLGTPLRKKLASAAKKTRMSESEMARQAMDIGIDRVLSGFKSMRSEASTSGKAALA